MKLILTRVEEEEKWPSLAEGALALPQRCRTRDSRFFKSAAAVVSRESFRCLD
jgi:hypothetical protein